MDELYSLIKPLCNTARHAGEIIMRYYLQDQVVTRKEDNSPVTEADIAANHFIVERLMELAPEIPIVSEEGEKPEMTDKLVFWLVDPLDGTKSFIRREGEFTVNIGLIERGRPTMGVIYVPAQNTCYWGIVGQGAWRQLCGEEAAEQIHSRTPPEDGLNVVASRSHFSGETAEFMKKLPVKEKLRAASSLKFCRLAEGAADLYPRFGPTMEWDVAAGHAILTAAGGRVETPNSTPFTYGKPGFLNGSFIAWGR